MAGGYFSSNPEDRSIPVSIRMNNPGAVNGASWARQYPGYLTEIETTPGNRTTIFSAPEYGVAVWWELMKKYRAVGAKTVGEIIQRYGGGQDYSSYIGQVVRWTTLEENEEINLEDDEQLLEFAKAMFRYEAGRVTPLKDEQIVAGFRFARARSSGKPVPEWSSAGKSSAAASTRSWGQMFGDFLRALFGGAAKEAPPISSTPPVEPPVGELPWMAWATREVGFHESGTNRNIGRYTGPAKCGSEGDPWCAIFVNAALESSGIRGTRSAMARSFEHNENFVKLDGPAYGAITTMWRGSPSSGQGHVFFYIGHVNDNTVLALGGNQSDQVCRQGEQVSRIMGYFWPRAVPLPRIGRVRAAEGAEEGSET